MSCCRSVTRFWLQVVNLVESLIGVALLGVGIYLIVKARASFDYVVVAAGVLSLLTALVGAKAVGGRSPGLARFYMLLLFVAVAGHGALGFMCLFREKQTLRWIQRQASNSENGEVERDAHFLTTHIKIVGYFVAAVVGLEAFSLLVALLSPQVTMSEREQWDADGYAYSQLGEPRPKKQRGGFFGGETDDEPVSETPKTDAERQRMNSLYGNRFEKRGGVAATGSATSFV